MKTESQSCHRVATIVERLRGDGHRLTPQRLAIVEALVHGPSHPTVDDLHSAVVAATPGIGLATIYNTLELLEGLGEVLVLDFGEGRRRYDGREASAHAHLFCSGCNRVDDVGDLDLAAGLSRIARQAGYQLLEGRVDLRGLCPACCAQGSVSGS